MAQSIPLPTLTPRKSLIKSVLTRRTPLNPRQVRQKNSIKKVFIDLHQECNPTSKWSPESQVPVVQFCGRLAALVAAEQTEGNEDESLAIFIYKGHPVKLFDHPFFNDTDEEKAISYREFKDEVFYNYVKEVNSNVALVDQDIKTHHKLANLFKNLEKKKKKVTYRDLHKVLKKSKIFQPNDQIWEFDCFKEENLDDETSFALFTEKFCDGLTLEKLEQMKIDVAHEGRDSFSEALPFTKPPSSPSRSQTTTFDEEGKTSAEPSLTLPAQPAADDFIEQIRSLEHTLALTTIEAKEILQRLLEFIYTDNDKEYLGMVILKSGDELFDKAIDKLKLQREKDPDMVSEKYIQTVQRESKEIERHIKGAYRRLLVQLRENIGPTHNEIYKQDRRFSEKVFASDHIPYYYCTTTTPRSVLPSHLNYSHELPHVRDQTNLHYGVCEACATMKEWQEWKEIGFVKMSVDFLEAMAPPSPSIEDVIRVLATCGIVPENSFKGTQRMSETQRNHLRALATNFMIDRYLSIFNLYNLKSALWKYGPCLITLPVYQPYRLRFWKKPEPHEIVEGPPEKSARSDLFEMSVSFANRESALLDASNREIAADPFAPTRTEDRANTVADQETRENDNHTSEPRHFGYHTMLIVGYDDLTGKVLVRNSFGVNWGTMGHCELQYSELFEKDHHIWTCIDGPSKRSSKEKQMKKMLVDPADAGLMSDMESWEESLIRKLKSRVQQISHSKRVNTQSQSHETSERV